MDSLTQACLGGTIGGIVLGRRLGRKAVMAGALLATLPDLDSFIDYGDAVADYTYHRSFSHSLFVLTGLATLLALLLARLAPMRRYASFKRWWWFCTLVLLTHPLLDAFTTYGTQLLWPLAPPPAAWQTIFIIDPLYTLPLLVAVLIVLIGGHAPRALKVGLGLSCVYLAFTVCAKAYVLERLTPTLARHGLDDQALMVQPTPLNALLWRVTLVVDDRQLEAFVSLLDGDAPLRFDAFTRHADLAPAALALAEGRRLAWFAGPFLRYGLENNQLVVTDVRMGLPGAYSFAFAIAGRDERGQWQRIAAEQQPFGRPDITTLARLLQRIIDPRALCPGDLSPDDLDPDALTADTDASGDPGLLSCRTKDAGAQSSTSPQPS